MDALYSSQHPLGWFFPPPGIMQSSMRYPYKLQLELVHSLLLSGSLYDFTLLLSVLYSLAGVCYFLANDSASPAFLFFSIVISTSRLIIFDRMEHWMLSFVWWGCTVVQINWAVLVHTDRQVWLSGYLIYPLYAWIRSQLRWRIWCLELAGTVPRRCCTCLRIWRVNRSSPYRP